MSNINNAHLIHDHSTGRSSTRLHAPPGGKNSMGTGFGWADPEPVCSVKPAPAPVSESPCKQNVQNISERSSPASGRGFGDTGSSSIRLHAPSGGANSMGTSFGWDEPQLARPALAAVASSSSTLAVGTRVIYTQMGKAHTELDAEIVEIEPVGGRKDNIRIRFADGRERNTSADKLKAVAIEEAMCALSLDQENVPPATSPSGAECSQEDPVSVSAPAPQHQALKAVEGAGVGELQIGQKMKYRQTKASEPEEVTVVNVELPSSNGFMRTKTFYQIRFDDGRTRETTIDKLAPR